MSTFDEFAGKMREIAEMSRKSQEASDNERQTCIAVILPFLNALGYDHAERRILAEYDGDQEGLNNSKVDFALKRKVHDVAPIMVTEAKKSTITLNPKHRGQLRDYFNNNKVKVGMLTNGVDVHFYTDLYDEKKERMDSEPFFEFNLQTDKDDKEKIRRLYDFHCDNFKVEEIKKFAKRSLLERMFKIPLKKIGLAADDNFTTLMIDKAIEQDMQKWRSEEKIIDLAQDCFEYAKQKREADATYSTSKPKSKTRKNSISTERYINARYLEDPILKQMYDDYLAKIQELNNDIVNIEHKPYIALKRIGYTNFFGFTFVKDAMRIWFYMKENEFKDNIKDKNSICEFSSNTHPVGADVYIEIKRESYNGVKNDILGIIKQVEKFKEKNLKKNGG